MLWCHPFDPTLITHWVWETGKSLGFWPFSHFPDNYVNHTRSLDSQGGTELLFRLLSTCLGLSGQVR